jgi:hypothetical protein
MKRTTLLAVSLSGLLFVPTALAQSETGCCE